MDAPPVAKAPPPPVALPKLAPLKIPPTGDKAKETKETSPSFWKRMSSGDLNTPLSMEAELRAHDVQPESHESPDHKHHFHRDPASGALKEDA